MNERPDPSHPLGAHRVLDAEPVLPQAAQKLDSTLPIFSDELLIDVDYLNIDSASMRQMSEETQSNTQKIADIIMQNTLQRGKQQNKVTGSGGMLVGKIKQIGSKSPHSLVPKDRIASLVSLTLTPLHIKKIHDIDMKSDRVTIDGCAILFASTLFAKLPDDFEDTVSMALLDVAGAPAKTLHLVEPNQTVVIIGAGGKAGVLSSYAARKKLGSTGQLIGVEPHAKAAAHLESLNVCDTVLRIDATDPLEVQRMIKETTCDKMGDIVINVAPVPHTEMAAILASSPHGKVFFFSMATAFDRVVLGAEGVASTAELIFGNGYFPRHAEITFDLAREYPDLKYFFIRHAKSLSH